MDMHDMTMWQNERLIPHSDCWVRDNINSPTIELRAHIALRGGERFKFRLECAYDIQ